MTVIIITDLIFQECLDKYMYFSYKSNFQFSCNCYMLKELFPCYIVTDEILALQYKNIFDCVIIETIWENTYKVMMKQIIHKVREVVDNVYIYIYIGKYRQGW